MKLLIALTIFLTTTLMAEKTTTEDSLTQEQRFEMLFGEVVKGHRVFRDTRERSESEREERYRIETTPSC